MEPERLKPSSLEPANCPYPEPDQSSSLPLILFLWKYILRWSSLQHLRLPTDLFPSDIAAKTMLLVAHVTFLFRWEVPAMKLLIKQQCFTKQLFSQAWIQCSLPQACQPPGSLPPALATVLHATELSCSPRSLVSPRCPTNLFTSASLLSPTWAGLSPV